MLLTVREEISWWHRDCYSVSSIANSEFTDLWNAFSKSPVWKGNNMLSFFHSMKLLCQNRPISLAEPCFLENSGKIRHVWRSCLALFLQRPRLPQPLPTSLSPPSCPTSASSPRESALMVTYTWEELPENSNSIQILWWRKEGKISFEQTDISMSWYPGRTQHGN